MHLVGVQRLARSLPAASRVHSLTSRHLTARPSRQCVRLLCPRRAWLLGLMPLTGLSNFLSQHIVDTPIEPAWMAKDSILRTSACGGVDRARLGVGAGGEV
jgi:hypothetical protein